MTANDDRIRKMIAVRAYEIWETQGRPQGYDQLNWFQAEQEIEGSRVAAKPPAAAVASASKAAKPAQTTRRKKTSAT